MLGTNNERVGQTLSLLATGLAPFVDRECVLVYGADWENAVPANGPAEKEDVQFLLSTMSSTWRDVFARTLGRMERNYVSELIDARNRWANQEALSEDDAYRALDSAERLLKAISAPEQAAEIVRLKHELQRRRYAEEARLVSRRQAVEPLAGMPSGNLRPWREVVTPHRDIVSGQYLQAEFAADLHQVWRNDAEDEYGKPEEFFRRTFLTEGLRELLVSATRRLRGEGGDPVFQLQTGFGGGKTHSLIALYHLANGSDPATLPGVGQVLAEAGLEGPPRANIAVLVGQMLDPGAPRQKPDGTTVRTMWGELAWQLGGAEGYALVANADEARTNPGDALKRLLAEHSPCLILVDEWVGYVRQLYGRDDLVGGSFDTHMTFAQAFTDAAKSLTNAKLVVSIPQSAIEVGGEAGKQALERFSNVIFRKEAKWKPPSPEEELEIVRRRLFDEVPAEHARERDAVVAEFGDLYQQHADEFPLAVRGADYRRRIESSYPIHPELFDRLFDDWSALEQFQRTRGVLRVMAAIIHELWERDDRGLMIMPASVPIDADLVAAELTRYLDDGWMPVIAADVDGEYALPRKQDAENPDFGRYSATRRIARTIYMGSAPRLHRANKGIDDRTIKLGCVQPGEPPSTFGDALRGLADGATYLIEDKGQYWYALDETIGWAATDRARSRFLEKDADEEIVRRLRAVREPGGFAGVHWAPRDPGDVPDDQQARLVVLGPEVPHASGTGETVAGEAVTQFLSEFAGGSRVHRNMLVFLAPDAAKLDDLREAARFHLAWKSVSDEQADSDLDELSRRRVDSQHIQFDEAVDQHIAETFVWLLTPSQEPGSSDVTWEQTRVTGPDSLPVRVFKTLLSEEGMIVEYSGPQLRLDLDRVPLWKGDHIGLRELWSYYAQYPYLPRLRDSHVLGEAIQNGVASSTWEQDAFAYADAWDEAAGRYVGLVAGSVPLVLVDGTSVLVKPEVARRQLDREAVPGSGQGPEAEPAQGHEAVVRRFAGVKTLDPEQLSREAGQIATEIVQHLTPLPDADVEVKLEISAEVASGVPDEVVRTVSQNADALEFDEHEFERE